MKMNIICLWQQSHVSDIEGIILFKGNMKIIHKCGKEIDYKFERIEGKQDGN
jgi:hypothetical protein